MKTFYVEIDVVVTKTIIVKVEDESDIKTVIALGQYDVEESTESDAFTINSIDEAEDR
jgi:hypothetical protein